MCRSTDVFIDYPEKYSQDVSFKDITNKELFWVALISYLFISGIFANVVFILWMVNKAVLLWE